MSGPPVETNIGTTVVETPARVFNPTTEKYQDLRNLSEDGYCRQFLALRSHMDSCSTIDVDSAPVLTFDKDRFEMQETDGQYVLVKRESEGQFGEMVLNDTRELSSSGGGDGE